jgi:hypothetical protein
LGRQETLEKLFKRFEQHSISHLASLEHKLILLQPFISRHEVRHNIKELIAFRLSYKKVKTPCVQDFGKQLEHWVFNRAEQNNIRE